VRRSIQDDHLVCLVCGKQQKILRRHLDVAHQLTRRRIASGSGSCPTIPWPRQPTPGSVPRWPSAWAWDVADKRPREPGSPAAARDPAGGGAS
jgi:hypothetical protein